MIVFVDDFVGFVKQNAKFFSRMGYETISFTNPQLALNWMRENKVDILVTNNSMPHK